ncbi:hypothetical protein KI387_042520, partial [Taxus chinensis]
RRIPWFLISKGRCFTAKCVFVFHAGCIRGVGNITLRVAVAQLARIRSVVLFYFGGGGGLRVLIFVALVGLRVSEIESAGRAVLPKFYMEDLNCETWRVFSSFSDGEWW